MNKYEMNKYEKFENEVFEESSPPVAAEHLETNISTATCPGSAAIVPQVTSLRTVGQSRFTNEVNKNGDASTSVIISDPAELDSADADVGYVVML